MVCEVKVIHGACDGSFNVAGSTVGAVRRSLKDAFNIPKDAITFVGGNQVEMSYRLQGGSCLEFCKQAGIKGKVEMLTQEQIHNEYVSIPKEILEAMFKSFPHDDINKDGKPIWLESSVDAWIRKQYSRKRADDGRDKVIRPNRVRFDGQIYEGLTNLEFRLFESLLARRTPDDEGVKTIDVIEDMWGHDADDKDNALKLHISRVNTKLTDQGWPGWVQFGTTSITLLRSKPTDEPPQVKRVSPTTPL